MERTEEYIRDLSEIRAMMERSSRFLSLTGWSGIMAGIYALLGAYLGYELFYVAPTDTLSVYGGLDSQITNIMGAVLLATTILLLAVGTAILLSWKKAKKANEKIWNASSRRLLINMAIPLFTGGLFILILLSQSLISLVPAVSLIFYGLALLNASKYTFEEVKYLGIVEIILGLVAAYYIGYGLMFWAIGFGIMHIVYGIYMHLKHER